MSVETRSNPNATVNVRSLASLPFLVLLCAMLLVPRLGAAHLHLCLDGSSPAVALHLASEPADELPADAGEHHDDQTVEVSNPILGKAWPPSLEGALLLVLVIVAVISRRSVLVPLLHALPAAGPPLFLRPPLRGPPA